MTAYMFILFIVFVSSGCLGYYDQTDIIYRLSLILPDAVIEERSGDGEGPVEEYCFVCGG